MNASEGKGARWWVVVQRCASWRGGEGGRCRENSAADCAAVLCSKSGPVGGEAELQTIRARKSVLLLATYCLKESQSQQYCYPPRNVSLSSCFILKLMSGRAMVAEELIPLSHDE